MRMVRRKQRPNVEAERRMRMRQEQMIPKLMADHPRRKRRKRSDMRLLRMALLLQPKKVVAERRPPRAQCPSQLHLKQASRLVRSDSATAEIAVAYPLFTSHKGPESRTIRTTVCVVVMLMYYKYNRLTDNCFLCFLNLFVLHI